MNRRKFIWNSSRIAAGSLLLPFLLQRCKKSDWDNSDSFQGEVIIVGAGLAGLYAGQILLQQGVQVKILEQMDYWGGRMRSISRASGNVKEAETKTIHGQFSVLADLLRHQQIALEPINYTDLYYFNGSLNSKAEAMENSFFREMMEALENLNFYDGPEITAQGYFEVNELSSNVISVYDALAGQIYGTDAARISATDISRRHSKWSSGEQKFKIKTNDLEQAVASNLADAIATVQYNTTVEQIDYTSNRISVTDTTGSTYACDRILIAAPVNFARFIQYNPPLNESKQSALGAIRNEYSISALFRINQALWPAGTHRVLGSNLVPYFEVNDDGWVFTDVCGLPAEKLSEISTDNLSSIQNEFIQLFPEALGQIAEGQSHVWAGSRSYDSPNIGNAREQYAQPSNNKLFFAGEGTHTGGHHGTLHGAMETGLRAAMEILQLNA